MKTIFPVNGAGITGHVYAKKKIDFISVTKINSNQVTDINVICKTIKLLLDNIRENLDDIGCDSDVLDTISKFMKKIIAKLGLIKVKNFYSVKDNIKRTRRQGTDWGKNLRKTYLIKDFIHNIQRILKSQQ